MGRKRRLNQQFMRENCLSLRKMLPMTAEIVRRFPNGRKIRSSWPDRADFGRRDAQRANSKALDARRITTEVKNETKTASVGMFSRVCAALGGVRRLLRAFWHLRGAHDALESCLGAGFRRRCRLGDARMRIGAVRETLRAQRRARRGEKSLGLRPDARDGCRGAFFMPRMPP